MVKLDRNHLFAVADAVIQRMEYGGESYLGLDGKRPFGFSGRSGIAGSVLEIIGADPDGSEDGPGTWSEAQEDYAMLLYEGVLDHIKETWGLMRSASPFS